MAMDKNLAKQAIHASITHVKQFLAQEAPPKLSEADTKANFIEPILSALGWAGIGIVVREYYVKNSQEFIDYVMSDKGKPLLGIEAKALQADLTEKASAQLVQYCVVEGIEWAALTNGRELRFFNTYLKGDLAAKLVLRLDLLAFNSDGEYEALFDQLWLLSRESMTTPSGVSTWLEQRRMDQALRVALLNPASTTIKALRKHLAGCDIRAGSEAIVQWFRAQLGTNVLPLPMVSEKQLKESTTPYKATTPSSVPRIKAALASPAVNHYILPCAKWYDHSAVEHLKMWLDRGMWGMYKSTPCRTHLQVDDRVCFFTAKGGIVAHARIAGKADIPLRDNEVPGGPPSETLYRVPLDTVNWLPVPIAIDAALRASLDAFQGKPVDAPWAWIVQTTRKVTMHDFEILTGLVASAIQDTA